MKKRDILKVLERVAPAMLKRGYVAAFSRFCFDGGETVTTTDDKVALQASCSWAVDGCLPGEELLSFLKASNSRQELVADQTGNEISIKLGRADAKFDVLPRADFKLTLPPAEDCVRFDIDEDLIDCLKKCCVSAEKDETDRGWLEGVTLVFEDQAVRLYASDNDTASRAQTSRPVAADLVGFKVQLKTAFCRLLVDIDRDDYAQTLVIHDDWVRAEFESGLILHAKRLQYADSEQYEKLFSKIEDEKTILIPAGFEQGVAKAASVVHRSDKIVRLSIKQGEQRPTLTVDAAGESGSVHESFRIDGTVTDFILKCNPEHIKRALPFVDEFLLCKVGVVFRGGNFEYMIKGKG